MSLQCQCHTSAMLVYQTLRLVLYSVSINILFYVIHILYIFITCILLVAMSKVTISSDYRRKNWNNREI